MHRIDSEGHDNNQFVDEDANNAIAGTTLAADWLNAIQEELINILVLAGIAPSKANVDQLSQAFQLLGGSKDWNDITNKPALIGVNQTWTDYTGVRESNVTYQNQTGAPLAIYTGEPNQVTPGFQVGATETSLLSFGGVHEGSFNIIPDGHWYNFFSTTPTVYPVWLELR